MYTQNLHTIQHLCATTLQPVPSFRQHLIDGRHLVASPRRPSNTQQRRSDRLCGGTSQKTTPTSVPCCSCAPVESPGHTNSLRTCQAPQEILRFLGPSASDLASDHHKPRATIPTAQLWVCSFLVLACLRQCLPISGVRLSSVCAISVQRRDHGGVYGQLAATKQRQTLRDDFQAACIASVGRCDVKVSEHDVRGHPGPSLSTNLRDGIFRCKSSSAKHPNCAARCAVVAKSVKWTATPAGANSEGQRQTKAAKQEDPIRFRIHLRHDGLAMP